MEKDRIPKQGEIFYHFKDKPCQIITVATYKETGETVVVYQNLYGDYKSYVIPLSEFQSVTNDDIKQDKIDKLQEEASDQIMEESLPIEKSMPDKVEKGVNELLLKFLDSGSYSKKLEIITMNLKLMNDRMINDMAASLDCTVDDGPLDQRIQELVYCLNAMSRFEDRRLR